MPLGVCKVTLGLVVGGISHRLRHFPAAFLPRPSALGFRGGAEAERRRTGQKRRGKVPQPVGDTPDDKAQSNFTDPERHIMRTNNKGWDYCGNAQASVDGACQIILACDVTDATNDKEQAAPLAQATLSTLAQAGMEQPTDESGDVHLIPATLDNGYYSEGAVQALEALGF